MKQSLLILLILIGSLLPASATSWTADNGNGTFTNPLFYDEFSDPDIIRVGDDFYLAGTTMHSMPGLVVLHSKDLVNWEFMSYCFDRLDLGDEFNLENGKEAYGQGIWAPCIRYHDGKFYVFSNVNGHGMQVFISENPAGPWEHKQLGGHIYDLSVLFDDDGKVYAIHKYDEVKLTEIKPDFSGCVEGSERVIIPRGNAMGEGHHAYKINGKYYILSADYSPMGRMQCARADKIEGPYETVTISEMETMGTQVGHLVRNVGGSVPGKDFDYHITGPQGDIMGCATIHQGGIVDLPNGEWWAISMQDFRSVGRTVCLSPITWEDGWPYFGLEGNLGRSPRTWTKPGVDIVVTPHAPYDRCDNFDNGQLKPVWQWNHNPVTKKWKIAKGKLRLNTLPASDFLWAKNTLTQRCIGPVSVTTVTLDASRLKDGDFAGIGIVNMPYSTLGVARQDNKYVLEWYDQYSKKEVFEPLEQPRIQLRITGDYDNDIVNYSYSTNGVDFKEIGDTVTMGYQLKTFQGSRIGLFAYNRADKAGGYAEFDDFTVYEPMADRSANLPLGKVIRLRNLCDGTTVFANPHGPVHIGGTADNSPHTLFRVHDRGNGRVVLEALNGTGYITVVGKGLSADVRMLKDESEGSLFMWQDMLRGQCMLMSLKTNRFMGIVPNTGAPYSADLPGATPTRTNGTVYEWEVVE